MECIILLKSPVLTSYNSSMAITVSHWWMNHGRWFPEKKGWFHVRADPTVMIGAGCFPMDIYCRVRAAMDVSERSPFNLLLIIFCYIPFITKSGQGAVTVGDIDIGGKFWRHVCKRWKIRWKTLKIDGTSTVKQMNSKFWSFNPREFVWESNILDEHSPWCVG